MIKTLLFAVVVVVGTARGEIELPACDGVPHAVDGAPYKNRFMTPSGTFKCPTVAGPVPLAQCLDFNGAAGTRCCDATSGTSLCPNEPCELVDFATAKTRCEAEGRRLCTTDEIITDALGEGSGCGFDHAPVWTLPSNLAATALAVRGKDGVFEVTIEEDGTVLYLATNGIYFDPLPEAGYDIEATSEGEVTRVKFRLVDVEANVVRSGMDETAPFTLGEALGGMDLALEATDYQLTATPFNGNLEGIPMTATFSVVEEPFNPVSEPVRLSDDNGTNVIQLQKVASFDAESQYDARVGGSTSRQRRINAMIPRGEYVYVVMESLGIIREVDVETGEYVEWFDVYEAVLNATGGARSLSITATFPHSGLRGLAFHDDFETNGLLYTSHLETHPADTEGMTYIGAILDDAVGDSVVAEWKLAPDGTIGNYRQLFRVSMPFFSGAEYPEADEGDDVNYENPIKQILLHEGNLYVCMGDGYVESVDAGGGRLNNAYGKILRVSPDGDADFEYTIPETNPFVGDDTYPDETYAVGFRNPHNIAVTEAGEILVVDIGRDNAEEVNLLASGGDYGWNEREGPFVHVGEGLLVGVGLDLPNDDADNGYAYPAALFGHEGGKQGATYREIIAQSIAGSCPVASHGSELDGRFFYGDFPAAGPIYYSYLDDIRDAVTLGDPDALTQAPTYLANIDYYDESGGLVLSTIHFRDVVNYESEIKLGATQTRNDMRMGCGPNGELLISSKRDGNIYTVLNSAPAA
ncbi:hypothetical protein CTAYLR_009560 [Chrysophaeum taylorii]|uniref:Glucose/Sorbosone dehydrogenase domain-containing protein n=1 Tax=Chrysophaeum taylorii TaxID=2483200 RepID=A0AAD7XKK2_9STRA|nr:hypothetical protein CTAYLR_009560 [Chrysophaeum taylorii]